MSQVARLAGVSWQTVARAESGDPRITFLTVCAVGEAVGLDVVVRGYPGTGPRLRDTGQLEIANLLIAVLHGTWRSVVELQVGPHGEAIDLVCFGASEILAIEIERLLVDWQAQLRRADAKRAALAAQHQRPVRLVVAVEDMPRNRRALEPHLEVVRSTFPAGSREVLRALRSGSELGSDALLWVRRRRLASAS